MIYSDEDTLSAPTNVIDIADIPPGVARLVIRGEGPVAATNAVTIKVNTVLPDSGHRSIQDAGAITPTVDTNFFIGTNGAEFEMVLSCRVGQRKFARLWSTTDRAGGQATCFTMCRWADTAAPVSSVTFTHASAGGFAAGFKWSAKGYAF